MHAHLYVLGPLRDRLSSAGLAPASAADFPTLRSPPLADCSLCIRRTLKEFKLECPACRAPGTEADLKPNHGLEAVVGAFRAARSRLLTCARLGRDAEAAANATPPPAPAPARTGRGGKRKGSAREDADEANARRARPAAARGTAARRTRDGEEEDEDENPPRPSAPAAGTRATRAAARASAAATPSTSTRPERAARRGAKAAPAAAEVEDDDRAEDEENEEDEEEDEEYRLGSSGGDSDGDGDDAVSESDWEGDGTAARDEIVDLAADDDDGGGGGGGGDEGLAGRQPAAPATTPGSSSGKNTVCCPICGVGILEAYINSHVDVCLTKVGASGGGRRAGSGAAGGASGGSGAVREAGSPEAPLRSVTTALMAKLPKLVYHIMKDKALKKLMSDAGLMTTGRREQMIARHKEFTLRVNAAIDSGHQPNLAAIAREVGKLERDRYRAANGGVGAGGGLAAAAVAGGGLAGAASAKADVFGKLIADVRARAGAARGGVKREAAATEGGAESPS